MSRLTGLVAAPFTPMYPDGSLNLDLIPRYASFLARNGISGVYILGSTGESASLTMDEKMALIENWANHAPDNLKVLANIGDTSVENAVELMRLARTHKLHGVGVVGPYYFKPSTADILVDYCARIAETVPEMPFYYYHIPELTGVALPMLRFLEKAAEKIPNLAGIKYTNYNLMEFSQCVQFDEGRFNLLWGKDEVLLAALAMGAEGAVGSTYNYAAPLYLRIMESFRTRDLSTARELQQTAINMVSLLGKYGGAGAGKVFMKLIGLDCGICRMPIQNVHQDLVSHLKSDLERLGFWQFSSTE